MFPMVLFATKLIMACGVNSSDKESYMTYET